MPSVFMYNGCSKLNKQNNSLSIQQCYHRAEVTGERKSYLILSFQILKKVQ